MKAKVSALPDFREDLDIFEGLLDDYIVHAGPTELHRLVAKATEFIESVAGEPTSYLRDVHTEVHNATSAICTASRVMTDWLIHPGNGQ